MEGMSYSRREDGCYRKGAVGNAHNCRASEAEGEEAVGSRWRKQQGLQKSAGTCQGLTHRTKGAEPLTLRW